MEREDKFNRYLDNIIGILALLGLMFILCQAAKADESDEHYGNFFTSQPVLEYVFVAANLADMSTTLDIKNHPGLQETNALLGAHPSNGKIYGYFAATTAIHAAITYELVSQDVPKPLVNAWECVSIAYEAGTVGHNLSFGLRFKF